ncbi:MAG: aminotransferase class V-fold PLP-dependent enzyme [Pseudomonadota bacterium]
MPRSEVLDAVDDDTFLVVLTHVHYLTGEIYDLPSVTARAHARGAWVLWDLSHTVGAVPVDLRACRADFAVGCTYKYLNGGPGSPAFSDVRGDLQAGLQPVLAGWMGTRVPSISTTRTARE